MGKHIYSGGFPAYFEMKLLKELGFWPSIETEKQITKGLKGEEKYQARVDWVNDHYKILHSFGGKSEYGIRLDQRDHYFHPDTNERIEMPTDIIGDAHDLPFDNESFDLVILDPPFNDHYAKTKWNVKTPKYKIYSAEASRVCCEGGMVVAYHWVPPGAIVNTIMYLRILVEGRRNQHARIVHIRQKNTEAYQEIGERLRRKK